MLIHTVVVDGPLALRMRRLDAAREGATGRQVLTLPLLAARLAGGFVSPASHEVLYLAIRQALEAGGYEDIGKVSELPGMPAAALSALRDWWDMEAPASVPDNARLRDFVLLERRVRDELPSGMLTPPDLVKAALARLRFAPKVLGAVTIQDVANIQAVWYPLIQALCDVVPVRWIASQHSRRDWFSGDTQTRPSGTALLGSADLCADPRNEVRESLRWARALVADGKAAPHEVAISAASPSAWDDAFLVLSREAGLPVHFTHGIPALATREGQACAVLADILLRGLSQERVRLLFARLPRSPAKENLPSDWAKGLRRGAALTSPTLWRHALEQTRDERANGDLAERTLLPILEDLDGGIASAEGVGRRLLKGPALSLWRDALRMAPPQAIELSLQALRVADGREPGNSIAWGPARHVAAAPRAHVRLVGLDANAWPRRSNENPLLPQHLLGQLRLPSAEAADIDRMMHDIIVGQSTNYSLSRAYRSATGSLQAASTFWPRKAERVVGRSAIPPHAFSESDRLYARPVDAGKDPQVRASRACWRAWWDGEQHTAHDGKVRANHPLVVDALHCEGRQRVCMGRRASRAGQKRANLDLDRPGKQVPRAGSNDIGQWIINRGRLTESKNIGSLGHGVSLSSRGSGRLVTRLDTPPSSHRHHPDSAIAPDLSQGSHRGPHQRCPRGCRLQLRPAPAMARSTLACHHPGILPNWPGSKGRLNQRAPAFFTEDSGRAILPALVFGAVAAAVKTADVAFTRAAVASGKGEWSGGRHLSSMSV
ncbi:hypothetical protein ACVME8_008787 [Bradyrhizobium diazoefficiens]